MVKAVRRQPPLELYAWLNVETRSNANSPENTQVNKVSEVFFIQFLFPVTKRPSRQAELVPVPVLFKIQAKMVERIALPFQYPFAVIETAVNGIERVIVAFLSGNFRATQYQKCQGAK